MLFRSHTIHSSTCTVFFIHPPWETARPYTAPLRILVPLLYHKRVGCQSNFCAVRFLYRPANSAILKPIREWKESVGIFRPAEDESMDKIIIRPMTPEDWGAVSRIYVEGIATEYATFQTECPPYTAWDASQIGRASCRERV